MAAALTNNIVAINPSSSHADRLPVTTPESVRGRSKESPIQCRKK